MGKSAMYRIVTAAISVFAGLVTASASAEEMAPLDIKLPRGHQYCVAHQIRIPPNVEKRAQEKRPPFTAPKGVTNVALGRPVTASDPAPIVGETKMATDGNKDSEDGSFVGYAAGLQWEQVDLGATHEIFAIVVWHWHQQERYYHDVVVRVSDDESSTSHGKTVFNNDHDNTSSLGVGTDKAYMGTNEGRLIDCKGVKGRYVRLYSNGNSDNIYNHLIEVEVYGRPVK